MEAKLKTDPNRISETLWKSPSNLERVDGNEIRRSHLSRHMLLLTIKYNFLYFKTNIMINVILYNWGPIGRIRENLRIDSKHNNGASVMKMQLTKIWKILVRRGTSQES